MYSRYFVNISRLKRVGAIYFNKRKSPYPWMLCNEIDLNCPVVVDKIFKFCQCFFDISSLSLHAKGRGPNFKKLEFPHPRMLCAKFGLNWLVVLEKKTKMLKV